MKIQIPTKTEKEIEALEIQLSSLRKKISEISQEEQKLIDEIFTKKFQCALDNGIFSENSWTMNNGFKHEITLTSHIEKHKILAKFFQTDYHCEVGLFEGVRMHFSDWDIYLIFENEQIAKDFIRKNHLQIDTIALESTIKESEKRLNSMNTFLQKIKELC